MGGSIIFSIMQQAFLLALAAMLVDCGQAFQGSVYAVIAYWVGFLIIMVRRRNRLTKVDMFLIRWGYIVLWILSPVVVSIIWNLRGC